MNYCIVITTCAEKKEADSIAGQLVENKLAACVQISKITSYYTWKGDSKKKNRNTDCLLKPKKHSIKK